MPSVPYQTMELGKSSCTNVLMKTLTHLIRLGENAYSIAQQRDIMQTRTTVVPTTYVMVIELLLLNE